MGIRVEKNPKAINHEVVKSHRFIIRLDRSFIVVFLSRGEERKRQRIYQSEFIYAIILHTFSPHVAHSCTFCFAERINYNLTATNIVPDERKFARAKSSSFGMMLSGTVEMLVFGPTLCATPLRVQHGTKRPRPGQGKRIRNRRCASRVDKSADARVSTIRSINISLDMISRGPLFHLASFTRPAPTTAVSFPS